MNWLAEQDWTENCSKSWHPIRSLSILCCIRLGCVLTSDGECCGCQSWYQWRLFSFSYHPSGADLASSVVSCWLAQVLGQRDQDVRVIGQTFIQILQWLTDLSEYLPSGAGCHLSVLIWLSHLFVWGCKGTILVSGTSMAAFELSIRANNWEALDRRPGPSGVMPLQLSSLNVACEKCDYHAFFGQ